MVEKDNDFLGNQQIAPRSCQYMTKEENSIKKLKISRVASFCNVKVFEFHFPNQFNLFCSGDQNEIKMRNEMNYEAKWFSNNI